MQTLITAISILAYVLLLVQYRASSIKGAGDLAGALSEKSLLKLMNARTIKSTPLMIVSLVLYSAFAPDNFFAFRWNEKSTVITVSLMALTFLISLYAAARSKHIIKAVVSPGEATVYFSIRVPGLIIYEAFFRGVLLGIALEWLPMPAAVGVNIAVYMLAHAFSPKREFIGSLFFGLLLCWITILHQSVYPAILLHLCLALPYEMTLFEKCQLQAKT